MRNFSDFCSEEFKDYFFRSTQGKNIRTINEYISYINLICNSTGKDFIQIKLPDATKYFDSLFQKMYDGKLTRKTVGVRLSCYRTIAQYIEEHDTAYRNPFVKIVRPDIKTEFDPARIPSLHELDLIMSEARSDKKLFLILALASRTGLSSSDILSITQTNIFNENNHTYIHFEPKNDFKKDIYLELPDDVATLMEQYVKGLNLLEKNECIFKNSAGAAMSLQNLDKTLKKLFKKCGLEKYTLKDFRNRAVLEMAKMGASKEEISEYTGLSYLRVDSFIKNKELIKDNCPANLVNYRLIV